MANEIQLKRSSVPNKIPDAANVTIGEPVVNLADQILYTKNATGTVIVIGSGTTSNIAEGTNLYFSNARVNTAISSQTLGNATFSGDVVSEGMLSSLYSVGDEGGIIELAIPDTNSTLSGTIAIDVFQNKFRIFETAGTNRGVYIDLTAANAAAGTNLLATGGGGSGTITQVAGVDSGEVSNSQLASAVSQTGILTTANVIETSNLYFSNDRVVSALTAGQNITIDANGRINATVTESGGASISDYQVFPGGNINITLNTTVSDAKSILVTIDGLLQIPNTDYTVSGTTLTWGYLPPANSTIEVKYFTAGGASPAGASTDTTTVKKLQYGLNILLGR